jgi:hypothetical protein
MLPAIASFSKPNQNDLCEDSQNWAVRPKTALRLIFAAT